MPKKAPAIQAAASLTGVNFLGYLCVTPIIAIWDSIQSQAPTSGSRTPPTSTHPAAAHTATENTMPSTWITFPTDRHSCPSTTPTRWQLLNSAENQSASSVSADLTFDPTQNEVYGIFFDGDYSIFWDPSLSTGLGLLNTETGRSTLIGDSFAERMVAIQHATPTDSSTASASPATSTPSTRLTPGPL